MSLSFQWHIQILEQVWINIYVCINLHQDYAFYVQIKDILLGGKNKKTKTTTSSLGLRPKRNLASLTNNSGVPRLEFKSSSATNSCVCDLEKVTYIFYIFKMQLIIGHFSYRIVVDSQSENGVHFSIGKELAHKTKMLTKIEILTHDYVKVNIASWGGRKEISKICLYHSSGTYRFWNKFESTFTFVLIYTKIMLFMFR